MSDIEKLRFYYSRQSKHSQYQSIAPDILALIGPETLQHAARYESARIEYILKKVPLLGLSVLDIGANTGYFSFEALRLGATKVVSWEGNQEHAFFLMFAKRLLNYSDEHLQIQKHYFEPEQCRTDQQFDFTFLLNVLHHLGDDFGRKNIDLLSFKQECFIFLKNLSYLTHYLAFQIGYCWHGKRESPIFKNGTKQNQIDFLLDCISDNWEILHIGIAQNKNNAIVYEDINKKNLHRDDSLGEFLNRPLFLLKSTRAKG